MLILKKSNSIIPIVKVGDVYKVLKLKREVTYCFFTLFSDINLSKENIHLLYNKCTLEEKQLIFSIVNSIKVSGNIGNAIEEVFKNKQLYDKLTKTFETIINYINAVDVFIYNHYDHIFNEDTLKIFSEGLNVECKDSEYVFPGGRKSKTDVYIKSAIREFKEEVGDVYLENCKYILHHPYITSSELKEDKRFYSAIMFPVLLDFTNLSIFKPREHIFNEIALFDITDNIFDKGFQKYLSVIVNKLENDNVSSDEKLLTLDLEFCSELIKKFVTEASNIGNPLLNSFAVYYDNVIITKDDKKNYTKLFDILKKKNQGDINEQRNF